MDTSNDTIPYGYCHCGCGQKTKIATTTRKSQGRIKGQPSPFLKGHTKSVLPPVERFWSKVDKSGGEDACWIWMAGKNDEGYGNFRWNRRLDKAHRVSYELAYGVTPGEYLVLHSCDNPSCVNPKHLSIGTDLDNNRDKERKGRGNQPKGEHHPMHIASDKQVAAMRRRYWEDGATQRQVAQEFEMSQAQTWNIVNFKQRI